MHKKNKLCKVSQTASFLGSKIRAKIIGEKSKLYKNSQNSSKIKNIQNNLQGGSGFFMRIGRCIIYSQFRDLTVWSSAKISKIHKTDKKILSQNKILRLL
jgi:hypothetical protein